MKHSKQHFGINIFPLTVKNGKKTVNVVKKSQFVVQVVQGILSVAGASVITSINL
jgi:siroheme synthase